MNGLLDYLTMACGPGALCGETGRGNVKMNSWAPAKSTPIPSFVVTSEDDLVSLLTDVDKNYRPYSRYSYHRAMPKREHKPSYGEQKTSDHEEGQDLVFLEVEHEEAETDHEEIGLQVLAVAQKDKVWVVPEANESSQLDSLVFSSFDSGMEDVDDTPKDENNDMNNTKSQDGPDDGSSYSSFYFHVAPSVGRALWSATKTNELDNHGRVEPSRVISKHQYDDMNTNRSDHGSSCSSYYFRLAPT
jgi:hypothetical protein